ncbi:MAG: ABC transporter permease [Bacteroidales bacterium]|nr:ABC transporter permease [Bacteroidales bacterium]
MRWYYIFLKGIKEQIRDYWILVMIIVMAPLFIFLYYLMVETETPNYDVVVVNHDQGIQYENFRVNLGDSLVYYAQLTMGEEELSMMNYMIEKNRDSAIELLQRQRADVLVVFPENFTTSILSPAGPDAIQAQIELVGDVTQMEYIIGAVWTEELINRFVQKASGIKLPISWKETPLGFSGQRSMFELYVPGLLILSIIMIIFSTSAAIVREPETRTLERLKISRLTSLEFLAGTSLVQIIIAILSLLLAILAALGLGYTLIPGTLGFILFISFLTALSMISFSLIVAAMCRSIKDVAIIGTFPLFLLMFFTGAAFPIAGGKLFTIGGYTVMLNDFLSPTWAVDALNKVLVQGQEIGDTRPEILALVVLTILYFMLGSWAFRRRHMRAQ